MRRSVQLLNKRLNLRPFLIERYPGWNDCLKSLSSSECEPLTLPELLAYADDEGLGLWNSLSLGYTMPSEGSDYVRNEIAVSNYDNITTHQINVCAPQEGISLALQALLSPGGHVVATVPCYQSLTEVARSIGCEVTPWTPKIRIKPNSQLKEYYFDPEDLTQLLRPNSTLITNFPHNPTGALPTHDEFMTILAMCDHYKSWLFTDEMYRGLEHDPGNKLPSVADSYSKGIALAGLSKVYGLPGLRIGWLACQDAAVMARVAELKDYTSICPPAPSECLAYIALKAREKLLARNHQIVKDGLDELRSFMANHVQYLEWYEPRGGTFSFVKLRSQRSVKDSLLVHNHIHEFESAEVYSTALRTRTGLMVIPSSLFPGSGDDKLRITYGRTGMSAMLSDWHEDLVR